MTLWTWAELLQACEPCEPRGLHESLPQNGGPAITGVSIDTRTLQAGDLFVPLSAARDGHEFIGDAEAKGAAAVMVAREVKSAIPQLRVKNTLEGLWALGRYARRRMHGRVAAITGSSGKTTARHWLQAVLAGEGQIHGSQESFNNHWGVPLSLARMPSETQFGVFEVGMNHPGEIAPLAELVAPDVALIVNVLPAHLGHFDSLDDIRLEKLSIARGLKPGGYLVVPDTLDAREADVAGPYLVTFGSSDQATVRGENRGDRGTVVAAVNGQSCEFELGLPGEHRLQTALAVLATAWSLGADPGTVCGRFGNISTPPGRGNVTRAGPCEIIDDSYNANPVSMHYALQALASRHLHDKPHSPHQQGRRIAVLGEMRELGPDSRQMHLDLAGDCRQLDGVITVGGGFADLGATLGDRHWGHYDAAGDMDLADFARKLQPGDVILVKGANKVFWAHGFVAQLQQQLAQP